MRYLDPKADLTFKRVFGEHPDLTISLLNALLPLSAEQEVTDVEYLPAEMVPDNPLRKNSIVDVRCRDKQGRQFIVEMQMIWSPEYKQRVLFNASKAYVRQIKTGEDYKLLQPVYSLNLVNDIFEPGLPECYHSYNVASESHPDHIIKGLHLVFVELPKFTPQTILQKRMAVLWLRFLTEIDEHTEEVSSELLAVPEIKEAVRRVEQSAYTEAQLLGYDKFWDAISVEITLYHSGERKGRAEGLKEGMVKGRAEGLAEGLAEGRSLALAEMAKKMKSEGMPIQQIAQFTGLPLDKIKEL